ncbi:hypothetical protein ACJIZ3_002474 [Penstemon smallii]|uniref:Uncharacterized protein n=1 Tax=Penstemon smallii TaxID=265156 RepID=A0ABD3U8E0_9LAMI
MAQLMTQLMTQMMVQSMAQLMTQLIYEALIEVGGQEYDYSQLELSQSHVQIFRGPLVCKPECLTNFCSVNKRFNSNERISQ